MNIQDQVIINYSEEKRMEKLFSKPHGDVLVRKTMILVFCTSDFLMLLFW